MKAQSLTARQARWASYLSEFNFDILHISGKSNPADPASRRSDYSEGESDSDKVVLLGYREDLKKLDSRPEIAVVKIKASKITGQVDPSLNFMPADTDTIVSIQSLYETDEFLKGRLPAFLKFIDNTWWWIGKVYVPKSMREMILKQYHETPLAGHWGSLKTLDMITRTFGWPNARLDVLNFIKACSNCQAIKVDHRPPQGLLNPLPIPD